MHRETSESQDIANRDNPSHQLRNSAEPKHLGTYRTSRGVCVYIAGNDAKVCHRDLSLLRQAWVQDQHHTLVTGLYGRSQEAYTR